MLFPFLQEYEIEAGCDEAGRGCLAGPVCAAAVILPFDFYHPLLHDSKTLDEETRYLLRPVIEEASLAFAVAFVDHATIDRINILQASFQAMHDAIAKLALKPSWLLIDGNRFKPYTGIPHTCVVKGDGRFMSIAAASVLAKTYRDDFMQVLHDKFPHYRWHENKGYPTMFHRQAIHEFGLSSYHRKTFNCKPVEQLKLDF
jgi:ribonuclease HII